MTKTGGIPVPERCPEDVLAGLASIIGRHWRKAGTVFSSDDTALGVSDVLTDLRERGLSWDDIRALIAVQRMLL